MVIFDMGTNTITFKSNPGVFESERDGKKCNTVRTWLSLEDVLDIIDHDLGKILKIKIINSVNNEKFERVISNIVYYYDADVMIFSWYHQSLTYRQIDNQRYCQ